MTEHIASDNLSLMHEITHSTNDVRWISEVRTKIEMKNDWRLKQMITEHLRDDVWWTSDIKVQIKDQSEDQIWR